MGKKDKRLHYTLTKIWPKAIIFKLWISRAFHVLRNYQGPERTSFMWITFIGIYYIRNKTENL